MPFQPQEHRGGKWLKFELGDKPQIVAVTNAGVSRGTLVESDDLELLLRKAQRSADGRLVGVFMKGGKLRQPGSKVLIRGEDGQPKHDPPQYETTNEKFVRIPDSVAPIRALLGADGSHNLQFAHNGQALTLLLALDSLTNVDLVTVREDIPMYRNDTLDENFDPALTKHR